MKKYKIQIVKLGNQRYDYVFAKLAKYKSDLFEVSIFEIPNLPDADSGWGYSTRKIREILLPSFNSKEYDMCIGFLDYQLNGETYGNCYGSNLKENKVFVLSFYQVAEFLSAENIELINYLIVNIYRYLTRHIMDDRIVHNETRGCINDMCGVKTDIVYSCKNPVLCSSCESKMGDKTFPDNYIRTLKKELKRIKKATYYRIADFIKKYPIISILIGAAFTIVLSIITEMILRLIP